MEHLLLKMARQLDSLDEASLLALWEKYAMLVSRFEPTKRWEEAALVFSLIQAKHLKNQLFNHNWAAQVRPSGDGDTAMPPEFMRDWAFDTNNENPDDAPRAKVIPFQPRPTPVAQTPADEPPNDPKPEV
ncbi:MAG: hypothetical protein RRY20_08150 [Bilophila sp.]